MTDDARARLGDLFQSMWTLGALSVAAERGILEGLAEGKSLADMARGAALSPDNVRAMLELLTVAGLVTEHDGVHALAPSLAASMQEHPGELTADLRSTLGQLAELIVAARDREAPIEGWRAVDPQVVHAQSVVSEVASHRVTGFLAGLPGLDERLSRPGAAMLDVGAGGFGLCITLARRWPNARVVGLEPSEIALDVGRQRVREAGLEDRIEVRAGVLHDLGDVDAFDLAWVAQMFMPNDVVASGLALVRRAMRPGGVLLTAASCMRGDTLEAKVSRFRSITWGSGPDRYPEDVIALVQAAGFVDARAPMPGAAISPIVARAP